MATTKSNSDNYVFMAVGAPVSASTSALQSASALANRLCSPPSKAKSVSFLLSEHFESDRDTAAGRLAHDHLSEHGKPATLPRYFVSPKFEYEDELRNMRARDTCGRCGAHSAMAYTTSEHNSPGRSRNSHLHHDWHFAESHDAIRGDRVETVADQSYRRHSVGGNASGGVYSRYNPSPQFSVRSARTLAYPGDAVVPGVDAYRRRVRTPRIFDNVISNAQRTELVSLDQHAGSAMKPDFHEDPRYYRGSVAGEPQHIHQLGPIPRDLCTDYEQSVADLTHNVYYIKAAACGQPLSCECACACPCSSPATHLRQLAVCDRVLPNYDTADAVEGYFYRYCDQDTGFDCAGTDEDFAVTPNDHEFRRTSLSLARQNYRHRTVLSICIRILWPCVFLHQAEREISESPPLPPPPPPPASLSQETLSTQLPASTSLKSKSVEGVDEGKTAAIRYSIISYSSSSSVMGGKCSRMPKRIIIVFVLCIAAVFGLTTRTMIGIGIDDYQERIHFIHKLLNDTILVDGHNDLAWNIRMYKHNLLNRYNYDQNLKLVHPWSTSNWSHTDLPRLRSGRVRAQMWSAYTHCESQFKDAIQMALEQIDLIKRFTRIYSSMFNLCLSYNDVLETDRRRKVCSIITLEGGHNIANSLAVLRMYYDLGVRSMALTNKDCSTPWAESAEMEKKVNNRTFPVTGLSKFGVTVVNELNRLGMVIDLSGTSANTMRDALNASKAPVVFSHSNARAVCNVTQNVPDDIIRLLVQNKGVIMVTFYPAYLNCKNEANVANVIEHINYLRTVAGVDHVGIGSGFDGIDRVPNNLNDTSFFPELFTELTAPGNPAWQPDELKKLAGLNILRVLRDVEKVRDEMRSILPYEDVFKRFNNKTTGRRYDPEMRICISHNHILN